MSEGKQGKHIRRRASQEHFSVTVSQEIPRGVVHGPCTGKFFTQAELDLLDFACRWFPETQDPSMACMKYVDTLILCTGGREMPQWI